MKSHRRKQIAIAMHSQFQILQDMIIRSSFVCDDRHHTEVVGFFARNIQASCIEEPGVEAKKLPTDVLWSKGQL